MGQDSTLSPRGRLKCRQICQSKDWSGAEFTFSSFSHKLGVDKKGESHEHNRTHSHFTGPAHSSGRFAGRFWRMDSPPRGKLLVSPLRPYGNNYLSPRHPGRLAAAISNPNCRNHRTHLFPSSIGYSLAEGSPTFSDTPTKS